MDERLQNPYAPVHPGRGLHISIFPPKVAPLLFRQDRQVSESTRFAGFGLQAVNTPPAPFAGALLLRRTATQARAQSIRHIGVTTADVIPFNNRVAGDQVPRPGGEHGDAAVRDQDPHRRALVRKGLVRISVAI